MEKAGFEVNYKEKKTQGEKKEIEQLFLVSKHLPDSNSRIS